VILRNIIPVLIASSCLLPSAPAQEVFPRSSTISPSSTAEHTQDFVEVVVPITSVGLKPSAKLGFSGRPGPELNINANFGTGFCLDAACRFIATNYHVALTAPVHKIKGQKVVQRYFATGPDDKGATANNLPNVGAAAYVQGRDLAIFELRRPLPHHHGLTLSLEELQVGQEVDILGYPKGMINPVRKLTRFPAIFKAPTTAGLLAFDYQLSTDKPIRVQGASGGIVVDRKTEKILGILSETTETMALAVPVEVLADFVSRVQPFVAQKIFPNYQKVPPVTADLYPKFQPRPDLYGKFVPSHTGVLQHRPEEPAEVIVLREKAQLLADSIRNFIAVQSFEWGSGDNEPAAQAEYEVRVIDGVQRFREYPEGQKLLKEIPDPHLIESVTPSDEWSKLPKMIGTEFRLNLQQAHDVIVNHQQIKVFQYYASVEDNLCPLLFTADFILFKIPKLISPACYGEVWTDVDRNIIRISEHLDLSDKLKGNLGPGDTYNVITYGWFKRANDSPRLVPLTIYTEARYKKRHVYWCRGQFMNYRVFATEAKIIPNKPAP
jgi:hypothetical protein